MTRAGGAAETEAKPLPTAPESETEVDLSELGPAELVQALQSGDLDTQRCALTEVYFRFEAQDSNYVSGELTSELISCGVVPAVVRLVQPDAIDACTTEALQTLSEFLKDDAMAQILYDAGACESCWAVVHRLSEGGGDAYAACMAMGVVARLLEELQYERERFARLHGEALVALLSQHVSLASVFLCKLARVLAFASDASELLVKLATAPLLRCLSACLFRFQAERLIIGGVGIIQTLSALLNSDAAPDYSRLRSCGVLAAVIPWMAAAYGQCFAEYDRDEARYYELAARLATNLVSAAYGSARHDSRRRLFDMVGMQPGAFAGVCYGLWSSAGHSTPKFMSDVLRSHLPIEICLLDSQLMMCHLANASRYITYDTFDVDLVHFVSRFDADCLAAISAPMPHQRLPAAASAGVMSCINMRARRLFASDDRIELVLDSFISTAGCGKVNGCSTDFLRTALLTSLTTAVVAAKLWPADDCGPRPFFMPRETRVAADTGEPPLKRQRLSAGTLTAADVNVQRRDSTVFLVAGRPFHAAGIILEKCSAVLADALRDAPAQASVTVSMPADVPEALHYGLFSAAVEHAYTGDITTALDCDSLFNLWCIGDYLCMEALCAWCTERLAEAFQAADSEISFSNLIRPVWKRAADRCAMQLCNMCATAYLRKHDLEFTGCTFPELLAEVDADAPPGCKPSAHVARVLRDALLRTLPPADEAQ